MIKGAPLVDAELAPTQTFDPAKQYRYTWPGQPAKVVSGAELTALCKGADPSMLAIEAVTSPYSAASDPVPAPVSSTPNLDEETAPSFSTRPKR